MRRFVKWGFLALVTCLAGVGTGCANKYGICPAPTPGHYYVTESGLGAPAIAEYKVDKDGKFEFIRYVR